MIVSVNASPISVVIGLLSLSSVRQLRVEDRRRGRGSARTRRRTRRRARRSTRSCDRATRSGARRASPPRRGRAGGRAPAAGGGGSPRGARRRPQAVLSEDAGATAGSGATTGSGASAAGGRSAGGSSWTRALTGSSSSSAETSTVSSSLMPSLNSFTPLPSERAISGSFLGPRTTRAITSTMRISCGPMDPNTGGSFQEANARRIDEGRESRRIPAREPATLARRSLVRKRRAHGSITCRVGVG